MFAGFGAFGWTDPISFVVGIAAGLWLASRYRIVRNVRIVRRHPDDEED